MTTIAVLIPCYNEESTIFKVVMDFKTILPQAEIFVYDNNSTDETSKTAEQAGANLRFESRQGKGNVIRSMFQQIEADCYLLVDGDDTYPSDEVLKLINPILNDDADMVIGDRLSSTYFVENKRKFHNFGNILVRELINKIFKSEIQDILSGYRAFNKFFIKNFPILSTGFEIETEMTIHALDKNFRIKEVPINYRDRPINSISKLNTFKDGYKVIITILRLFMNLKPLVFFGLIFLVGLVSSSVLFIPILNEYLRTGLVPRFPTLIMIGIIVTISLLSLVCGLILDTVCKKYNYLYEINLIRWLRENQKN